MKNRYEQGRFSADSRGLGTVSEEMVWRRAREIAVIKGRTEEQVLDSDRDEAYRELTGAERLNPPTTRAEAIPEDARWEGVPADEGKVVERVPAPDEQTFAEKLVEEGAADAEHDRALQATREAVKRDTESGTT